jgi:uncharacterized membrane protein YqiK
MSDSIVIILAAAASALVLSVVIFKLMWRVAEPNEALIISGLRTDRPTDAVGESLGFKIVTGKGTLVIPGVQQVRRLSLDLREAELGIDCVTHQGIPLGIRGVVISRSVTTSPRSPTAPAVSWTSRIRWRRACTTCSPGTSARSSAT